MTSQSTSTGDPGRIPRSVQYEVLTGLPGRTLLLDRLEAAIAQAQRHRHLVALAIVDLNTSTEMRAALGFEGGEELTHRVADHLREFARTSDTLAYIGNDLFAVVMPRVRDLPHILSLTARLIRLFDDAWVIAGQSLHLVPAVGIAYVPENGTEPSELVAQAVTAASYAAREGDQRPRLAHLLGSAAAIDSLALEADLHRAIERGELCLYYQPQVDTDTGCLCGFEALIRWQHPERGLIAPREFIPLAEATHLILPIGAWVIDEACAQLARWRDAGHADVRVAVNVAAQQLTPETVPLLVRDALQKRSLDPSQLEVEITESTVIVEAAATSRVIEALRNLGVRVTLDDFVTGYSSILLLADYAFDTLKIDRSFVARILDGARERAITAGIVSLAHSIGMSVVAEGVETREQLALARELGADEIQGFFFSRPLPVSECEPFLVGSCRSDGGKPTQDPHTRRVGG
jgi:diguanylate cyclase (GGDEF)-like protein